MPQFDQTGPQGQGPFTGRGGGRCSGVLLGNKKRGQGRASNRYLRCPFVTEVSPENEKQFLKKDIALLKTHLENLQDRLSELEKE